MLTTTNTLAKVVSLYISRASEPSRLNKNELILDDSGVLGDKFYGKDICRAILVTSLDAYRLAKDAGIDIDYGALGENILIDGNIKDMDLGETFKIGDLVFEITQHCTLCNGLSKIDPKLPKLLKDDRGIFIKAVNAGSIKTDDMLYV
ncbi:MOSC domain-containing protein [Sulfurimonas sp. HSL-1716]|uniref:MOSC domain-containing protein n=1 Tax=Hydrocurvibacter sulfurireducens TaxID=3131937 RepID=UPI0031F7BB2E